MGTRTNTTNTNKANLLKALEVSLGVVSPACKECGIDRSTFYDYYNDDEVFSKAVDEINNVALDFAETSLHKQIENGVPSSTMFYLKTKGKNRGYIERTESINTNKNTTTIIELGNGVKPHEDD
jgi:hypothetical protein